MEIADPINPKPKIRLSMPRSLTSGPLALTFHSSFSGKDLRMISLNSIASVSQEIGVNSVILKPRARVEPVDAIQASNQGQFQQRVLESVPAAPSNPMPRGSLLDLRV